MAKERSNPGFATILRLRDALNAGLSPLKRDLLPEVSQRPFVPHVMLTRGISEAEATELAQHAAEAQLHIEFMVDRIHLLQFAGSEGDMAVCRYAGFSLGRPTIIPLPLEPVI